MFSRIGFAIARRLAEDGANVVVSSRKASNVEEAVNEIKKFAAADSKCERAQLKLVAVLTKPYYSNLASV